MATHRNQKRSAGGGATRRTSSQPADAAAKLRRARREIADLDRLHGEAAQTLRGEIRAGATTIAEQAAQIASQRAEILGLRQNWQDERDKARKAVDDFAGATSQLKWATGTIERLTADLAIERGERAEAHAVITRKTREIDVLEATIVRLAKECALQELALGDHDEAQAIDTARKSVAPPTTLS